jgi:hypothetical protein
MNKQMMEARKRIADQEVWIATRDYTTYGERAEEVRDADYQRLRRLERGEA